MTNISTKNKIVYFNICILIHIRQMLWVRTLHRCSVLDTTLCDKVCQWLASGLWFSPGTPVSCNNKTDITEILLKVASACIAHLVIHISIVESGLNLHCSLGYSHFYLGSTNFVVSKTRIANYNHVFHQNEIKWGLFVDDFKCIICIM